MSSETDTILSMPELLRRVHQELMALEESMESLHPLVDLITTKVGSKDPHHLKAMQGIDHMEQMLTGLAGFLQHVSLQASDNWHVDAGHAVSQITLGDLARRLRAQADAMREDSDGDLEMFG
jgi:hypothetical protein